MAYADRANQLACCDEMGIEVNSCQVVENTQTEVSPIGSECVAQQSSGNSKSGWKLSSRSLETELESVHSVAQMFIRTTCFLSSSPNVNRRDSLPYAQARQGSGEPR
jgi:hypothetical protein